ncbi:MULTISPECIES: hypothetical protein [Streptomyces]|uniref:Uncharacterized protein n=1 Tax=Streptomyces spororaveus TaxID=284039 RepID=A0ABQ3TLH7_9ACTN|nr:MULTISPECIES: hypothetical protein [Streptomyces]MCM9078841.1 hypothetical protein [Streptomyces spororaveus]MCX5306742.1 hypothetical protein [Streptomyces sp. NBC_00160]GHI80837.1 hypothetical protein Sspor_63980 [Streptomyces spororaveus]
MTNEGENLGFENWYGRHLRALHAWARARLTVRDVEPELDHVYAEAARRLARLEEGAADKTEGRLWRGRRSQGRRNHGRRTRADGGWQLIPPGQIWAALPRWPFAAPLWLTIGAAALTAVCAVRLQ